MLSQISWFSISLFFGLSCALSVQLKEQAVLQSTPNSANLVENQAGVLTTVSTQSGDYNDVSEVVADALVSVDGCRTSCTPDCQRVLPGNERRCLAHNPFRGRPLLPFTRGLRPISIPPRSNASKDNTFSWCEHFRDDETALRPLIMESVVPRQHDVPCGVPSLGRD